MGQLELDMLEARICELAGHLVLDFAIWACFANARIAREQQQLAA